MTIANVTPAVTALLQDVLKQLPGRWVQHRWNTLDGKRCLGGWLLVAAGTQVDPSWPNKHALAQAILAEAIGITPGEVTSWNDWPGRTEAQVIAAVTKAIRLSQKYEAAAVADNA